MQGKTNTRNLIIKIAQMYYTYGNSQKSIAEKLGLSRGYVCQLLDKARDTGIVEIKVNTWMREESELEKHFRELFGLRKVIAVSQSTNGLNPELLRNEIVTETCNYLNHIVKNDMVIAFSWGRTIYEISLGLSRRADIRNVEVLPLCGGTSNLNNSIFVSEISTNIAQVYNGTPLSIPLPAVLESVETKRVVCEDVHIKQVLDKISQADIALFTVGEFGQRNIIYLGGYINDAQIKSLQDKGAVGDICARFIDVFGEICDTELDNRTISVDLNKFTSIPNKILIASGENKVLPLLGALRKKYADIVITNEDTIQMLLKNM